MSGNLDDQRKQAHLLLDQLSADKLTAVRSLELMVEPWSCSLALASVGEEELTAETVAALSRSRASLARGESIPHEEILREFEPGE